MRRVHLRGWGSPSLFALTAAALCGCGARSGVDGLPVDADTSGGFAGRSAVGAAGGRSGGSGGLNATGMSGAAGRSSAGGGGGGEAARGGAGIGGSFAAGAAGLGASGTGGAAGGLAGGSAGAGASGGAGGFGASGEAGSIVSVEPPRCEPAFSPVLDGYLPSEPGLEPRLGVSADFDGDGRLDVALVNGLTEIAVLRGNGDGTLVAPVRYSTGLTYAFGTGDAVANFLLSIDTNGDHVLDLVTASKNASEVAVLFGRGDGTFESGVPCLLDGAPQGLAAGDFDGDGAAEVAVSYRGRNTAGVILLRGDGSCSQLWGSPSYSGTLGAGDLNGDEKLDLAVTGAGWDVLLGNGMGSFYPGSHNENQGSPAALAVEDLNRDGALDVAITNLCSPWNDSNVAVYLGYGDGSFSSEVHYEPASCTHPVIVSDLNADDAVDLVVGSRETLLGRGDGTFGPLVTGSEALGSMLVGIGDFDGDGLSDAAVAQWNGVVVRKGNGDGTFGYVPHFDTGLFPASLALLDLNGDLELDVVTANGTSAEPDAASLSVLFGAGDATFAGRTDYGLPHVLHGLTPADMNADGQSDLVALNTDSPYFSVVLRTDQGGFEAPLLFPLPNPGRALAVGDLNGDAKPDVVVISHSPGTLSVFLAAGDGTFAAAEHTDLGKDPRGATLFDANHDGRLDFATSWEDSSTLSVGLGQGDGTFVAAGEFAVVQAGSIAAGDLNHDGHADLVTLGSWTTLLLGTGNGDFRAATSYPFGARYFAISDLDGDGHQDVLLSESGFTVLRGAGDGTLACFQTYALGGGTGEIGTADLNGDGREDVVATLTTGVGVFLNAAP